MKAETCRGGRHFLVKGGRHFLVKLEGRLRRSNAANASRLLSSTRLMPTAEAATPRSFVQSRRTGFFEFTISAICNATVRARSYHIQAAALGGLDKETLRVIRQPKGQTLGSLVVGEKLQERLEGRTRKPVRAEPRPRTSSRCC